jgi:malate dehydrogenase
MFVRHISSGTVQRKVALLGAAGGIGQPLSLLLKLNPNLSELALYDIANMGMAVDLSHISTAVRVTGHSGEAELPAALKDAQVVIIPAGVPRKPGMTRDDLFAVNAGIVRGLAAACARHCPSAHLLVISNPVNSTVPIAYEVMRAAGVNKPSVFGVLLLPCVV